MSQTFFILNKNSNDNFTNNNFNTIHTFTNTSNSYLLPQNLLTDYIQRGLFEQNLIDWTKQFCSKSKNFLDIGAHTGTYAISLADYSNKVYAFEPQKMTYYALCGSVALSSKYNIECYQIGLGSSEQRGFQTLNINSIDGGGSSIIDISNKPLGTEIIEVKTLDDFNITNIGFIKMDVENNELNVLHGALETLKNSSYPKILFEFNKGNNADIFTFLKNLDYKVINISGTGNMYIAEKN